MYNISSLEISYLQLLIIYFMWKERSYIFYVIFLRTYNRLFWIQNRVAIWSLIRREQIIGCVRSKTASIFHLLFCWCWQPTCNHNRINRSILAKRVSFLDVCNSVIHKHFKQIKNAYTYMCVCVCVCGWMHEYMCVCVLSCVHA